MCTRCSPTDSHPLSPRWVGTTSGVSNPELGSPSSTVASHLVIRIFRDRFCVLTLSDGFPCQSWALTIWPLGTLSHAFCRVRIPPANVLEAQFGPKHHQPNPKEKLAGLNRTCAKFRKHYFPAALLGTGGATGFLAGTAGATVITTAGTLTGSGIAVRGMAQRTRQVQTFELLPLYNNKRVNCIFK